MKHKQTIEITWYDPTEVPVRVSETSDVSVDVILHGKYKRCNWSNWQVIAHYHYRSKEWLYSTDNEPVLNYDDNEEVLIKWTYIPQELADNRIINRLIEQVKVRCYDDFKRLESIR